jgi:hypothetical protein
LDRQLGDSDEAGAVPVKLERAAVGRLELAMKRRAACQADQAQADTVISQ